MKLTILKNNLKEGLLITERISQKLLTLPILNNIHLKTENNFLVFYSTDLEVGIKFWTFAKIEKEGEILIPAKILSPLVNYLPEKQVLLFSKDNTLNIDCENYKTQIQSIEPSDFPLFPKINKENSFISLDSRSFCQALSQVADFATPSTTRPEISGIFFSLEKNLIKLVATDSFRLGEKVFFIENLNNIKHSIILPQKTVKEVVNIFGEKEGGLNIYFGQNQVLFEYMMAETQHPQIHLISRLIDGEFPDYQRIIPQKYETQILLPKNEFINQIKTASLFSGKINDIKFKINPKNNKVEVFSKNPDFGEYYSFLPAEIKGKEIEISFNYKFLLDGIPNIKSPELIFELNGENGPGVLKPERDDTYLYVVMPIKAS